MSIGIYDSGLGGLSVWRELRKLNVPLVYFGDTANMPYGDKTPEQLSGYFWDALSFFAQRGCTSVVVACNTTSSLVLPKVGQDVDMPVIGIIEAAVQGVLTSAKGRVGILATKGTVESGVYQRILRQSKPQWKITAQGAPILVPLVEQGKITDLETKRALSDYLAPLLKEQIDTLLLGCTHYPFLLSLIRELVNDKVEIIDPSPILASQIRDRLVIHANGKGEIAETEFWVSANPEQFRNTAQKLLGVKFPSVRLYQLSGEKRL